MCQTSSAGAVSFRPATNVESTPWATQCAAVRIRSPVAECSTAPVHVCSEPAPRNTAPTLGSGGTGCAVGGILGVTVAACSTGGCFAHPEADKANATNSPVARTVGPAAGKRMMTDLAATPRPAPLLLVAGTQVECDMGGVLFEQMGGPQSHLPRNARH